MPSPLISLVITTYNREHYLGAALESILAQSHRNFELLVWDDGSSDRSVAIAQQYAQQDERVRVIAAPHQGRVGALKAAIAQTQGEYLGWVDSDDLLAPNALEATLVLLEQQPTVGMVYTDYIDIDASGKALGYGQRCSIPYSRDRLLLDFMTFHFRLLRRSLYDQVGGIDDSLDFVEDYDLCLKLSEVTEIVHLAKPLYYYRQHGGSASQEWRVEQVLRSRTVIQRALKRRGLASQYEIHVEIPSGRFLLQRKRQAMPRRAAVVVPWLATLPLAGMLSAGIAQAQISPAADGTNTIVTPNGNRFDITGGQTSRDGANLFQTFQQFGLNQNQIANFLATPGIRNILGRVVGGDASVINGLIQVTGSNANLFLMNPAGIVFGANASLNVPGAFTATTANGIGIGNQWFSAVGTNDYAALVGIPNAFAFTTNQSGAVINTGNLAVGQGQSLTLLGGTVINTGSLTAPGGTVTIAAVPGEKLVRISQDGSLMSLELPVETRSLLTATPAPIAPLSLPALLTGGNAASATGITVNPDGTIRLSSAIASVPITPGTAIAAGAIDVSNTNGNGGAVSVLGDRVGLIGAMINAMGTNGGSVMIGGDYLGQGTVPNATFTYVSPDTLINANSMSNGNGGRVIVWADDTTRAYGTITANGGFLGGNGGFIETSGRRSLDVTGSTISANAPAGQPGLWLLDPFDITIGTGATSNPFSGGIFTPSADSAIVNVTDLTSLLSGGTNVTIRTDGGGGAQAGNINILAPISFISASVSTLSLNAANDIRLSSLINITGESVNIAFSAGGNIIGTGAGITTNGGSFSSTSANFNGNTETFSTSGGAVSITASGNITTGSFITSGGSVDLRSGGNIVVRSITTDSSFGPGGAVNIDTGRFLRIISASRGSSISTASTMGSGGAITIRHGGGGTPGTPFVVGNPSATNGTAAAITTGTDTILPPPPRSFSGSFTQGQIQIIAQVPMPVPTPVPTPSSPLDPSQQEDLGDDLLGDVDTELPLETAQADNTALGEGETEQADQEASAEFEAYLDVPDEVVNAVQSVDDVLSRVGNATGVKPALVYASFIPSSVAQKPGRVAPIAQLSANSGLAQAKSLPSDPSSLLSVPAEGRQVYPSRRTAGDRHAQANQHSDSDQLELVIVTAGNKPVRKLVAGATRGQVLRMVRQFTREITDPRKVRTTSYLATSQQLYRWLVAPIEAELKTKGIGNVAYISDTGLRFIPMAALHDGKQFLVEKYSVGLMPSFNLTDSRYVNLKNAQVLAMGASEFRDQSPLPAVPTELAVIAKDLWQGKTLLNGEFTLANVKAARQKEPYQIIHLATHGEFQPGALSNSYIQLWDTRLQLNQLRQLGWNNPPVELLVLSACRTALGNNEAELGFAGVAVQAGVKSAIASLWYVSDDGTLGLMTEFYRQLKISPIKAEALRQAQLALLHGQVKIENGKLSGARGGEVVLPPAIASRGDRSLTHPYYWASFTMIGSPW